MAPPVAPPVAPLAGNMDLDEMRAVIEHEPSTALAALPEAEVIEQVSSISTADNTDTNRNNTNADVMLKVMMVVGRREVMVGDVCNNYSVLVSHICQGEACTNAGAEVFREALSVCEELVTFASKNPVRRKGGIETYRLTVSMVDLMRTACFASEGDKASNREYSRMYRSAESKHASPTFNFVRTDDKDYENAYVSADVMNSNFRKGIEALRCLRERSDEDIITFVDAAAPNMSCFITSLFFSHVLDGTRLIAGNAIATRFMGRSAHAYGTEKEVASSMDPTNSMRSVRRMLKTISAICAMARHYMYRMCGDNVTEASKLPAWDSAWELMNLVNEDVSKAMEAANPDAPALNTKIYNTIADWFDKAIGDSRRFSVIDMALKSKCLVLGKVSKDIQKEWLAFTDGKNKKVNAWTASEFVIASRLRLPHVGGGSIITAMLAVFSGAIGKLINIDVDGPFVFHDDIVEKKIKRLFSIFPDVKAQNLLRKLPNAQLRGKSCSATPVTRLAASGGDMRNQHEKSELIATRLAAGMFFLSLKECIRDDLEPIKNVLSAKAIACSGVCEGNKGLRRVYVSSFITLPCIKNTQYRSLDVSFLIERSRDHPSDRYTTKENTERPWRSVMGGVVVGTLMFHMAGRSFVEACSALVSDYADSLKDQRQRDKAYENNDFTFTTAICVKEFTSRLKWHAAHAFQPVSSCHPDRLLVSAEGAGDAAVVMDQQLSLYKHIIKLVEDSPSLWQDLQLTFSKQKAKKKASGGEASTEVAESDRQLDDEPPSIFSMAELDNAQGEASSGNDEGEEPDEEGEEPDEEGEEPDEEGEERTEKRAFETSDCEDGGDAKRSRA